MRQSAILLHQEAVNAESIYFPYPKYHRPDTVNIWATTPGREMPYHPTRSVGERRADLGMQPGNAPRSLPDYIGVSLMTRETTNGYACHQGSRNEPASLNVQALPTGGYSL